MKERIKNWRRYCRERITRIHIGIGSNISYDTFVDGNVLNKKIIDGVIKKIDKKDKTAIMENGDEVNIDSPNIIID